MNQQTENNKKLKAFFNTEYNALTSYVKVRIRESIDQNAEDIIQDVALKLFSGANGYSPINNVASFVYRSLKNKIIDLRRKKKYSNYTIDEIHHKNLKEVVEENLDDILYSKKLEEQLKQSILNLKQVYRDVIIAIDLQGYTYKELSESTGISKGTLMSRRHRALGILLKNLKNNKIKN
ncbi:RNA polymerase sigma factor [Tenacibaculum agarivorans]|uniref:RNA polymerase sigma factor n=1 Tax=Tenacibaculum agarivorans TaxID=1908389 RepID=UPI00094B84D9|nr:RNA polymerase sigma factor [Tenacibaculum agarivorans]